MIGLTQDPAKPYCIVGGQIDSPGSVARQMLDRLQTSRDLPEEL